MAEKDYGRLENYPVPENPAATPRRSQVYQATHAGEQMLPYMNRSFISFSYGGKNIEEYDLIATISGNSLNKKGYASFQDTVSTYDNLNGQQYWATHYQANQLDFVLATDGIDQKKLDSFLYWFKAGVSRELVLAEHPNRGIMARVSQPPTLDLLPFEQEVEIVISSETYKTKTTLYKGSIQLSLVMDSPHWYSIVNILGKLRADDDGKMRYVDYWDDVSTGREISVFASQDALKILYEDGIPLGSMIDTSMLLGNGAYANVDNDIGSLVWDTYANANIVHVSNPLPGGTDPTRGGGACIQGDANGKHYRGLIAGAIVNATDQGIESLPANVPGYFYYSGTAPAPTIITFTLTPYMTGNYFSVPGNSYRSTTEYDYNMIQIESLTSQTLRFTTPNIFTSYNKAIRIFELITNGTKSWEDIRKTIRDQVRHPHVRAWAIKCIEYCSASGSQAAVSSSWRSQLQRYMSYMFIKTSNNTIYPATFTFNSETGESYGWFTYKTVNSTLPQSDQDWLDYGELNENVKEDVGDMLRSNYIIIQDRNETTSEGKVVGWLDNDPIGNRVHAHRIKHNVTTGLSNLQILYKNMYL